MDKTCPLSLNSPTRDRYCLEAGCAIYNEEKKACALLVLSSGLLGGTLESIIQKMQEMEKQGKL